MQHSNDEIMSAESIPLQLNSRTIEYGKYFTVEGALPQLLVLVEDEDDVMFWQTMFACVEDKYSSIHVATLHLAAVNSLSQTDAEGNTFCATGKDALMQVSGLGKCKMLAVDADYDMIITDHHTYTDDLRTNKYIHHTEYHSIENHLLESPPLISRPEIDALCSEVEDLLYFVLGEIMHHVSSYLSGGDYVLKRTINDLRGVIGAIQYRPDAYSTRLHHVCESFKRSVDSFETAEKSSIAALCANRGYTTSQIWQLIQGHTLYEYVAKFMVYELTRQRKLQEKDIRHDSSLTGAQKAEAIQALKQTLLNGCEDEEAKFRADVYNCKLMDGHSLSLQKIQNRIICSSVA